MDYFPESKMRLLKPHSLKTQAPNKDCPLQCKPLFKNPQSINTEQKKKPHPQICNSSLGTEMTTKFFLAAAVAALINLHHFSVNFDEGWGREMKVSRLGEGL